MEADGKAEASSNPQDFCDKLDVPEHAPTDQVTSTSDPTMDSLRHVSSTSKDTKASESSTKLSIKNPLDSNEDQKLSDKPPSTTDVSSARVDASGTGNDSSKSPSTCREGNLSGTENDSPKSPSTCKQAGDQTLEGNPSGTENDSPKSPSTCKQAGDRTSEGNPSATANDSPNSPSTCKQAGDQTSEGNLSGTENDSPKSPSTCRQVGDLTSEENPSDSCPLSKTDLQTEPTLQIVNAVSLVDVSENKSKADSESAGISRKDDESKESSSALTVPQSDSVSQKSGNASMDRQVDVGSESSAILEGMNSKNTAENSSPEVCNENVVSSSTDKEQPSDCGLKIESSRSIQETHTEGIGKEITPQDLNLAPADALFVESEKSSVQSGAGTEIHTVRSPDAGEPMDCNSPKNGSKPRDRDDVSMEVDEENKTVTVSSLDVHASKATNDTEGGDKISAVSDDGKNPESTGSGDPLNSSKPPSPTESEGNDSEDVNSEPSTALTEKGRTEEGVLNDETYAASIEKDKTDSILTADESCTASNEDSETLDKNTESCKTSDKRAAESENIEELEDVPKSVDDKSCTSASQEGEKSSATADADDEVCIVPDTEPRVPTEKEKANAVEKANKVVETTNDVSEKGECEVFQKRTPKFSGTSTEDSTNKETSSSSVEKDTSDKDSTASKRKFGIQLVSTSALVSKKDMSEQSDKSESQKDTQTVDSNESRTQSESVESGAQNDIQTMDSGEQKCGSCQKVTVCKYKVKDVPLCEDECYSSYRKKHDPPLIRARKLPVSYTHKCGQCCKKVDPKLEKSLTWETMDFCSEGCLEKYQKSFGSHCANCKGAVQSASLGKYCVRFGYDMKQFCCAPCLEDFKKGLKVCSYCQKDISGGGEGFLAPVGDKGQFKDFCTQECMEKYDMMSHNTVPPQVSCECAVCNEVKIVKVEIMIDSKIQKLCSEPCFAAFKFVNNVVADQCDMCRKYYDHDRVENFTVFYDDAPHSFCCKTCMNVYILAKRKIVPCSWCKVKKYNFDMIKKTSSDQVLMLCSLHCLHLHAHPQSQPPVPKKTTCEFCNSSSPPQFHLTMSDASVRNFCSYNCVVSFQAKFPQTPLPAAGVDKTPYPLGLPRRILAKKIGSLSAPVGDKDLGSNNCGTMPVISSVTSLAPPSGGLLPQPTPSVSPTLPPLTPVATQSVETVKTVYKQQFIIRPPAHPEMSNCGVQVKPKSLTKGVSCRPHACSVGTQTDDSMLKPLVIPVPVPIFIPIPMHMYTSPYPVPVPIALPIPVPIFIPTTRNSAKGIFKEIKRIQEKMPSDPYEAELLMMAEMVANEKKAENTDSDSDDGGDGAADVDVNDNSTENTAESDFNTENVDGSNSFGDDVLQMALKIASELDEPAVDFESAVTSSTIAQTASTQKTPVKSEDSGEDETEERGTQSSKKRTSRTSSRPSSVNSKRARKSSTNSDHTSSLPISESKGFPTVKGELVEKADASACLKFTLGVNAWKGWVNQKNAELEKSEGSGRKIKLFKPDLLQLTADELNYSLCLFVKEVRKPNGQEYAPDTVYYLCLGIQQYLIENGRVENIFSDPYYEKFTECLDEVTKQFSALCNETQQLVTRIEEEHLWESKQLGAHSPYVLLSTLMYFNTKHFSLMTVDEHLQLSFSHIMKHWKRNQGAPTGPKAGVSRNVLLRFYPPQAALAANSKKKRVYEQQENEKNPLRCPVKLYEFYISKCPESVRTRNDVFYLLPERSCVPDSPVWYSTMALGHEQLQKMLNRIKMVKEILML